MVDADARVHGMGNLFVAGSSVFPTYGVANPTLEQELDYVRGFGETVIRKFG